jgi:hypothetical protein
MQSEYDGSGWTKFLKARNSQGQDSFDDEQCRFLRWIRIKSTVVFVSCETQSLSHYANRTTVLSLKT